MCYRQVCPSLSHTFIPSIDLCRNVLPSYGGFQVLLLLMIFTMGNSSSSKGNQSMVTKPGSEAHKEASYRPHLHADLPLYSIPEQIRRTLQPQVSTFPGHMRQTEFVNQKKKTETQQKEIPLAENHTDPQEEALHCEN